MALLSSISRAIKRSTTPNHLSPRFSGSWIKKNLGFISLRICMTFSTRPRWSVGCEMRSRALRVAIRPWCSYRLWSISPRSWRRMSPLLSFPSPICPVWRGFCNGNWCSWVALPLMKRVKKSWSKRHWAWPLKKRRRSIAVLLLLRDAWASTKWRLCCRRKSNWSGVMASWSISRMMPPLKGLVAWKSWSAGWPSDQRHLPSVPVPTAYLNPRAC